MVRRKRKKAKGRTIKRLVFLVLLILLVLGIVYLFSPLSLQRKISVTPVKDYSQAENQIRVLQRQEKNINPLCYTRFLTHSKKTDRVIIFFHGFTACPKQFDQLATEFYNRGYNVVIPLIPHHGNKDLMTEDLKNYTAEEAASITAEYIGIAGGLGEHITVAGLSAGGVMAAWAAQNFDVDKVVLMDPIYPSFMMQFYNPAVVRIVQILPPIFIWWDDKIKNTRPSTYIYPRYSAQGMVQVVKLGSIMYDEAKLQKPKAKSIVVITNANDQSVDNKTTAQVVSEWQKNSDVKLKTYEFPKDLGLGHDIVAPESVKDKSSIVYSKLIELIAK